MSTLSQNSIRLTPRSADFLNRRAGARGELFYDQTSNTLRIYNSQITGGLKLATENYVDTAVTGLATEDYVDTAIGNIDIPEVDLTGLATENYVDTAIGNIDIPEVDLTGLATENYVDTAIGNLIDTAPTTLNTLNELAAALNDDANFASTVATAISGREPTITGGTTGQYWRGDKSWQTLNATAVGLSDVTNESKATMFTSPTFTGTTTFSKSTEIYFLKTEATGTVVHDFSESAIWSHENILANFTANFTNVPTTSGRITVVTLLLVQGATPRIPNAIQINGVLQTILWLGGIAPTGTANRSEVVSFTLIRSTIDSFWTVAGSLTSYG